MEIKKKNKKIKSLYFVVILILLFTGFFAYNMFVFTFRGNVSNVHKDIESSQVFETNEIEAAMDVVIDDFKHNFHGCTLKELSYSDEKCLDTSLAWKDEYNADKAIVIKSVFDVPVKGASAAFNPGTTYTWYDWVLIFEENDWIIKNKGMG